MSWHKLVNVTPSRETTFYVYLNGDIFFGRRRPDGRITFGTTYKDIFKEDSNAIDIEDIKISTPGLYWDYMIMPNLGA